MAFRQRKTKEEAAALLFWKDSTLIFLNISGHPASSIQEKPYKILTSPGIQCEKLRKLSENLTQKWQRLTFFLFTAEQERYLERG